MIQRIQSIFLLITSLGFWSLFLLPFATSDTGIPTLLSDKIYNIHDHIVLLVLAVAGGLLSLVDIFLFGNRNMQLKLNYILIAITIILPLITFLLLYNEGTAMVEGAVIHDEGGLYAMLLTILFGFLSARFIQKDNKIVESMDRLR